MAKRKTSNNIPEDRRSNILSYELTPEDDAALVKKFREDPRLFMESYLYIKTKDNQVNLIRLNVGQIIVYNIIMDLVRKNKPVRLIVLKARQLGVSTLTEAFMFWRAILWPNTECIVVSHDTESVSKIFRMTQRFYDRLPQTMRPLKRYGTRRHFVFENPNDDERPNVPGLGSTITIATARNTDVGASQTLSGAHLSELARWENAEDAMLSLQQAIPSTPLSIVVIESTAQGVGGLFYDLWQDATKGQNEWTPVFLPFWIDPQYEMALTPEEAKSKNLDPPLDRYERKLMEKFKPYVTLPKLKWRRWKIVNDCGNSKIRFDQEYAPTAEECFAAQGQTIFDKDAIDFFIETKMREGRKGYLYYGPGDRVLFEEDPKGPLTVWKPPHRAEDYVIGIDSALGPRGEMESDDEKSRRKTKDTKRDYHAACVMSSHREQVAEFHTDMIEPYELAEAMAMLGKWYNTALLYPEVGNQGGGWAMGNRLKNIYPRIGVTEMVDQTTKKLTKRLGFEPNKRTVGILMSELMMEVRRGAGLVGREQCGESYDLPRLQIRSRKLLDEMTTFALHEDGKLGAKHGAHDDLVRALGLSLLGMHQIPVPRDLTKKVPKIDESWYDSESGVSNAVTSGTYPGWLMI